MAETRDFKRAEELIERFMDDPDPPGPDIEPDSLHLQVAGGKEPSTITTVLGHLAWAVQKLALQPDHFNTALRQTERLLDHQNLYVKQQACLPLVELALRARYLLQKGEAARANAFKRILLDQVEGCGRYAAVAKKLVNAALDYLDFDEVESHFLLDRLGHLKEAGPLYFLLSMPMDDAGDIREVASVRHRMEVLLDGESLPDVRGKLVWWLSRQLRNCDLERQFPVFRRIMVPLIARIWKTPHNPSIHGLVVSFFKDLFKRLPEVILDWNLKAWTLLREHLRKTSQDTATLIHISFTRTLLEAAAEHGIEFYSPYIFELFELWKVNVYIGTPEELFQTVEKLPTADHPAGKRLVRDTYDQMIAIHPAMPRSVWLESISMPPDVGSDS